MQIHPQSNHPHSLPSQWGYNSPESFYQPPYQHSALYTPYQDHSIEEKSEFDKILEVIERRIQNLKDS